jgi:uncharacterized protein (TIGR02588 family)
VSRGSGQGGRTAAEWLTFAAACLVLLAVLALIAFQVPGSDQPAAPHAQVASVRGVGSRFHVEVDVRNDGDDTAANVQVTAELVIGPETMAGDQTIDFLAGGEEEHLVFVFADDPAGGELTVEVTGFADP